MFNQLLTKLFGSRNDRNLRHFDKDVQRINQLEAGLKALSDDELKAKTESFKQRVAQGESLDKLLPEAFAVCREASIRTLGLRHYDVQLIGGMVLHTGRIAEMRTGEGKTLVATLPVYLNALAGKGVHVVTVNDYLARRDAATMGKLYNFLGLSVGVVVPVTVISFAVPVMDVTPPPPPGNQLRKRPPSRRQARTWPRLSGDAALSCGGGGSG